ncbi:uncharacterized protein I206_102174 [Kwoniella pini CBS 10737]|uniref:Uncharacterized protein n=1 Tax=Kwoniella pini CBS 10737 TaxID=1296096 RepID=A0A1B9HUL1_9TREE|nr:uncharacterized protein I206_06731 [Kwoniella pini CBS 10737]OCF46957.1 hypothetical protein I206_06731 [Kwoniella pini CBS 10737]
MWHYSTLLRILLLYSLTSSTLAALAVKPPNQTTKPKSYSYKHTNRKQILQRQEKKRIFNNHERGIAQRAIPSAFPGIPDISPTTDDSIVYYFFHYGIGSYETFAPPIKTDFPGDQDQGQVVHSCADFAWDQGYFAFQVYYRLSTDTWTCVSYVFAYPEDISSSTYFNVVDPDVTLAYGYQHRWID